MFKKIAASSSRFNLRQSIKRLNNFIDDEERLISDEGNCSPNNEPFMRSVILDFKYFMEYWEFDAYQNPSEKIIREFNEYLFSSNYHSNVISFQAWNVACLRDSELIKFNSLLNYYDSKMTSIEYMKQRAIVKTFVKDILHYIENIEFDHNISKANRDEFISFNALRWG
tara:strand:+ start:122 stop:628 length:507 start_codon:yes stop_codon:yes gene_type:complete